MTDEEATLDLDHSQPRGKRLVAIWGDELITLPLPKSGQVVVGRARECDLCIEHSTVSRRHAIIRIGDTLTVEDLGSQNGTGIDGRSLARGETAPFRENQVIEIGIARVLVEGASARRNTTPPPGEGPLIASEALAAVYKRVDRVAGVDINVLIQGETGVGKEHVAATLHRRSPRASGPMVTINCAAIPGPVLESELFGHTKGAFTGAHAAKEGLFVTAKGGTVFLDEVGEMPLDLQAKFLRVLEEHMVMPVGSLKPQPIDVRFVAATNRELERDVAAGKVRADLFFRLGTFVINVPPLRERTDEILPLARHFAANTPGVLAARLSPAAEAALMGYGWPGNVRELKNVIQRASVLCDGGVIEPQHLELRSPAAGAGSPNPSSANAGSANHGSAFQFSSDASERQRIEEVLAACGGNQSRAAEVLGISRSTLIRRLSAHGIIRPRKKE